MAVVLPGVSFARAASPNPMQLQGYHIQHQVPPIHQLQAPYSTLQAGQVPFLAPQVLPYRVGSAQPQQHQPQPSSQWPSGPSTHPIQPQPPTQPQIQAPSQPLPPLPPHNEVPLNRDQLANILEYFSTLVPSHFDNRGLRLIVHGGACMLLHPGLYALSKEHEQIARQLSPGSPLYPLPRRQTTRDVDYLHRAFVKDWQRLGVDEANRRLKDCVHVTARAFGLGADWMNSDADISLPMADDGKGKIFDPIYHAALMPNNIDLHTVFMSKNQKLTLVSVAPVWSVALKLRRYAHFDPGDICLILKNGTKLNKVRWSESTLEGWLRKEAWPMGYHNWTDAEVAQWRARVRHAIGLVHAWPSSPVMGTTSMQQQQQQQQQQHHPMPSTTPGPTLYGTPALGPLQPPHQHQHQQNPMFGGQHVLGGRVVAGPGPGPAHPGSQVPTPTPRPSTSHYAGASVSPAGPSTAVAGGTSGTSGNAAAAGASSRTRTPGMPLQMYDLNVEREFDDMRLDGPTLRSRQRDRERERDRERGRERDGGVYGGKGHQRAHSSMGVTGTGTGTTAMGSHALTLTWHQQAQAQTYSNPNGHHAHSQSLAVPYSQHVADQGTSGYDLPAGRSRSRPSSRNGEADIGLAVLPPTPSPNPERRSRDKDRTRNRRMERLEKMAVRSPDPAANDFNRERERSRDEGRYYSDRERDRDRDREQAQENSESRSRGQPPGRQPTPGPSAISRDYAYGSSLAVPDVSGGGHSVDTAAAQGGGNIPGTQHTMWHSHPNPRPATTQPRASPVPGTHLSTWYGQGHHAQPSSLSVPYGSHALGVAGGSNGELERGRTRSGPPDDGSGSRGRSRSKSQKRRPPPLMLLSPAMTDNLRVFD